MHILSFDMAYHEHQIRFIEHFNVFIYLTLSMKNGINEENKTSM